MIATPAGLSTRRRRVVLASLDWTRPKDPRVPLGMASLVAALNHAGHVEVIARSWSIVDDDFDPKAVVAEVLAQATGCSSDDVDVGIGVYVWNDHHIHWIIARLRSAGFAGRIVLGGPQVTYASPGLERIYPEADAFVRGYGEDPLVALTATRLKAVCDGLHYAGDDDRCSQAQVSPERLPSPFLSGVIPVAPGTPFVRWETQRGCPFSCSFCQHGEAGLRLKRRAFSFDRVRQEAELFVSAGVKEIAVLDPIFNLGQHAIEVLRILHSAGYQGRLSLQCRFELLTSAFLDACAGLDVHLEFGLQTIHENEGRAVERVNDLKKVDAAIRQLHARRIPFEVSLIFGLPEQTRQSFLDGVRFCVERGVPVVRAFPLMLLRGTALERDRSRWSLVENDDEIPAVIASSTFNEEDWNFMAGIARALALTEGRHPRTIEQLTSALPRAFDWTGSWSPAVEPRDCASAART